MKFQNKKGLSILLILSIVLLTCVSASSYQVSETPDYLNNFLESLNLATIIFQGYEEYKYIEDYPLPGEVYADTTLSDEKIVMKLYQSVTKVLNPSRSYCMGLRNIDIHLKTKVLYSGDYFEFIFPSDLQRCYRLERTYYKKTIIPEGEIHKTQSFVCKPNTMTWSQGQRCEQGSTSPVCRWCSNENHNSYYDYYGKFHCASSPLDSWCLSVSSGDDSSACNIRGGNVFKDCSNTGNELVYDTGFEISNMPGYYCCFVSDVPTQVGDSFGDAVSDVGEGIGGIAGSFLGGLFSSISAYVWIILIIVFLLIFWRQILMAVRFVLGLLGIKF